jgi:hypothetical protein
MLQELRELAEERALAVGPEAGLWRARKEVLDHLIRQGPPTDEASQASLEAVMTLLAEASVPEPLNPSAETSDAAPTATEVDEPAEVAGKRPLAVAKLQFCRAVRGFGDYEAEPSAAFRPAQVVTLYCEMEGVTYASDGDAYRSRLDSSVEILPEGGGEPLWRRTLGGAEDVCRRPRRDYYVNYQFTLPSTDRLPSGSYRLRLVQHDTLSDESASALIPIVLVGP